MKLKVLIVGILILFITSGCSSNKYDNYTTISEYVNKNYDKLYEVAQEYISGNKVEYKNEFKRISVYTEDNVIVEFLYSENDTPIEKKKKKYDLNKIEENKWEWKEEGDNHGITIKIRDNWYYYEASF